MRRAYVGVRIAPAAYAALALVLGGCGGSSRPAAPVRPAAATSAAAAFAWLPAGLVAAIRAPGAGAPMVAFFARSPRRPPCLDAALAGVRESLQLQLGRGARMALVLVGALDRERLEACGIEAARALLGVELAARRDGALTYFERASERASDRDRSAAQVAGFAGERAVLADTAGEVRAILAPPRALGPADPLGPLLPRLAEGELAAITTIDPLAPWTRLPARAASLRLVRSPALRAEARLRYASADEARRALAAVGRLIARDEVPFAIRRAFALVAPAVDEAEVVIDLSSLFAPEHAALLQGLMRELAPATGTP